MSLIPFEDLATSVINLIPQYFPTEQSKEEAKFAIIKAQQDVAEKAAEAEQQMAQAQSDVNKVEAANANGFTSGWRPYIGWICGTALGYHFILQPLLAFGFSAALHPVMLPDFDMTDLNTILLGMLGLGSLRTFEKVRGVA